MIRLTRPAAGHFYDIHREKPFYPELVDFMTEGAVVVAVLEKGDAVEAWRALMGATNPANAAPGTIRRDFAEKSHETWCMVRIRRKMPAAKLLFSSASTN